VKAHSLSILAVWAVAWMFQTTFAGEEPAYVERIEIWRVEREADLQKDSSWLTVAGLYWLRDGENWAGTDPTNDFVLPKGTTPGVAGVFEFHDRETTFRAAEGVSVTLDGKPAKSVKLEMGEHHAIRVNDLTLWLHYSGERLAIRIRDLNSTIRKGFAGLEWFPVDEKYRVTAKFVPHDAPREIEMLNILGDVERFETRGYVYFEFDGESIRMEPVSRNGGLWFVFRDGTSGAESYPAARFLSAEAPIDGKVIIDFNRAYNPPCAFNPHTTCPMPTKENRLKVRIEAGEKNYKQRHS
jgi:uncharacterized protein (DUF1684 family)